MGLFLSAPILGSFIVDFPLSAIGNPHIAVFGHISPTLSSGARQSIAIRKTAPERLLSSHFLLGNMRSQRVDLKILKFQAKFEDQHSSSAVMT